MSFICCNSKNTCSCTAVLTSIVIGIIAAVLRYTATITITAPFLWVLFGIGVVYLAILPITAALVKNSGKSSCICTALKPLLAGILGTILLSVILLGISFSATGFAGAIIIGANLASFSLTLTSTACLTACAAKCSDNTCA